MCDDFDTESEVDEFKNSEIDITKFKAPLFPRVDDETPEKIENQFCKAVLYAIRFYKNSSKDVCTQPDFEKLIDKNLIEKSISLKSSDLLLNCKTFMNFCYEINSIL